MDIKFEEFKNELNLTLSIVLVDCDMERVLDVQGHLAKAAQDDRDIGELRRIEAVDTLGEWAESPVGRCVYIYPRTTIHFSMLNYLHMRLGKAPFDLAKETVKNAPWFESLRGSICDEAVSKLKSEVPRFEIRGIFSKAASPSIALMAFPDKKSWLSSLREINRSVAEVYEKCGCPEYYRIANEDERLKAYWDGESYFAVNIVRFLRAYYLEPQIRARHLSQIVSEQDYRLRRDPVVIEGVQPKLVLSDAYLSNPGPAVC